MYNNRPVKIQSLDTSCCAGVKEFTFYVESFPFTHTIYNEQASNYIYATVDDIGLQTIRVTFPSLVGKILNLKSIQVIGNNEQNIPIVVGFNNNNTVDISHADLGSLVGLFTVRIWINFVEQII